MKRKLLFLLIIMFAITTLSFACTAKTKTKPKSPAAKKSAPKSQKATKNKAKTSKQESKAINELNNIIMPAADIIEQVRDTAKGIVSGKTTPETAVAIYSGADRFLIETRANLIELETPASVTESKNKSIELVKLSLGRLDDLTEASRARDEAKLESLIKQLDEDLKQLRLLIKPVKKDDPGSSP